MSDSIKIRLVFKIEEGFEIEEVVASKSGKYYKIDSMPFFAHNIALYDLVAVEKDDQDGKLYFDKMIKPSGNSTIQVVFFDENYKPFLTNLLESNGCTWEDSPNSAQLIAINVPKNLKYSLIRIPLRKGQNENKWSYREASLSHTY